MADDSARISAESALGFDEVVVDPEHDTDDPRKLPVAWHRADELRDLLARRPDPPTGGERNLLKAHLISQLGTLYVYWQMGLFMKALANGSAPSTTAKLYVLLFPGEAKDNTGIKDLNDKVMGYWWNAVFIEKRFAAIQQLFDTQESKYVVAAQNYKAAYILTYERTREDFAQRLAKLNEELRLRLIEVLELAKVDPDLDEEKKKACKKLQRTLQKKGNKYKFDFFFGLRQLSPGRDRLENTYLLVTEALKGAAIARFVSKGRTLGKRRPARKFVTIGLDKTKLDTRGKEYVWTTFMKASDVAEKIKALVVGGFTQKNPYDYQQIYVDTVWTVSFLEHKQLYWGNPDVVRDVRKKKLEPAPIKKGNLAYAYVPQKELLELWLVVLNMLDFVKQFDSREFKKEVARYHDVALESFIQCGTPSLKIDWDQLKKVLTHDVRQTKPIAVYGTASEFQFYSSAADNMERIMFNMDARDMGVELMLDYEHSNRVIGFYRYSDVPLMEETFRATDVVDQRRRDTYDAVVRVFRAYHAKVQKNLATAKAGARAAFGPGGERLASLPSFEDAVQVMLGGDEVFVAAHPLFAAHIHEIVRDLDATPRSHPLEDQTLDIRTGVAFSRAKEDKNDQRREIQRSHQEAIKLADASSGALKTLERTDRRIARLIEMLEANKKKQSKAPPYRAELDKLRLSKLFGRAKHGNAKALPLRTFRKLLAALEAEKLKDAEDTKNFELVDYAGNVVDVDKLVHAATSLEDRVRRDVGFDNVRVQVPPVRKVPKWVEKLLDCWEDPSKC